MAANGKVERSLDDRLTEAVNDALCENQREMIDLLDLGKFVVRCLWAFLIFSQGIRASLTWSPYLSFCEQ